MSTVEFVRTIGGSEAASAYVNLTDDLGRTYGDRFPKHRTRLAIVDERGRVTYAQKHHGNQIWGSLRNWYDQNRVRAGTKVRIRFDRRERTQGLPTVHMVSAEVLGDSNGLSLDQFVIDFRDALKAVDRDRPQAVSPRSKKAFRPGIGPHSEEAAVRLVSDVLRRTHPSRYGERIETDVPYPGEGSLRCDLCIGSGPNWDWAIEVKLFRMLGDNGKPNDNMIAHLLSPYQRQRSAVTDAIKLLTSEFTCRRAILVYGFETDDWPLEIGLRAFESLVESFMPVSDRISATVEGLVHPVHARGGVFAWELVPR